MNLLLGVENFLHKFLYEKVPHIPVEAKKAIVQYIPWAVVLLFVAKLASILSFFKLSTILAPLGSLYVVGDEVVGIIGVVLLAVAMLCDFLSVSLLSKYLRRGWLLIFYSILLSAANNIITLSIGNLLFMDLLMLYVLFQIREYYK